ncbi:hypothetical protein TCAL_09950, partial [Tigriopus californicus]
EALIIACEVRDVLLHGNFNLRGWATNNPKVANELGEIASVPLRSLPEDGTSAKILGLIWETRNDVLGFNVEATSLTFTRRGLLSRLAGLYDPLGLISPVTISGKIQMKSLVVKGLDWDDPVDLEQKRWWNNWNHQLIELGKLKFPRCISSLGGDDIQRQLHVFCDASEDGFCAGVVDRIWNRWTTEYLPTLLTRNKWSTKMINIPLGTEVLVVGTPEARSKWKMGTVTDIHPSEDGLVRAVTIRTPEGVMKRPITKICPLQPLTKSSDQQAN